VTGVQTCALPISKFNEYIEKKYAAANGAIMQSEDEVADVYEMEDE
jgi:hypothetical protein